MINNFLIKFLCKKNSAKYREKKDYNSPEIIILF